MAITSNMKLYREFTKSIKDAKSVVIFRKDNPDADAYGSQLGLKELLKVNYPDKEIYAVGQNSEYLNPIGRMDEISDEVIKQSAAIVVDCASAEWVDLDSWKESKNIIKIDDHPEKDKYGNLDIVDTSMSTCSELICDLAFSLKWRVTPEAARCFLLGILDGTSYFRNNIVSKHTFIILGKLIEIAPDVKEIFDAAQLVTDGEIRLKKYIVNHFKTTIGGTTYLYIPYAKLQSWDVDPNRVATFIWLLLDMSQGEFTMMFTEYEDKKIRAQFRSKTRPVNLFAAKYGGWGTTNSAGAFLENKKQIKEILTMLDNETI